MKFYAVAVGRNTGVFLHWSMAQQSTDKFSGACHKSFESLEEAAQFLHSFNVTEISVHINESTSVPICDYNVEDLDLSSECIVDKREEATETTLVKSINPSTENTIIPPEITTCTVSKAISKTVHDAIEKITSNINSEQCSKPEQCIIISSKSCAMCTEEDHEFMIMCNDCNVGR